ncbi:class D beta-lactamase [Thalassococcus sp. S3]|uniref:class D beta-lactamase n=1 Tax=Thalassococcus sp. S3 TaxID=2017482 RepID=UPI0010241A1D|nr:class D beta-lactamase [Thalassococcus sp. S3]QBF32708.1 class D beta-lactamase [Thalassococcus sp. S3]
MRLTRRASLIATFCAVMAVQAHADQDQVARYVADAGVDPEHSVIVVRRMSDGMTWTSNPERADERFRPASTSKIPHTLIALETGYATPTTQFTWDGKERWLDAWNRDQTLATAFRRSVVWVYQQIARDLGPEKMSQWLEVFQYGNAEIGAPENVTEYWLRGPLAISANEQIDFLAQVAARKLPLADDTYTAARIIMLEEAGGDWALYAKTGWNFNRNAVDIGWYAGWVERAGEVYLFAYNMDMRGREDIHHRQGVTLSVLRELGVLPTQ